MSFICAIEGDKIVDIEVRGKSLLSAGVILAEAGNADDRVLILPESEWLKVTELHLTGGSFYETQLQLSECKPLDLYSYESLTFVKRYKTLGEHLSWLKSLFT